MTRFTVEYTYGYFLSTFADLIALFEACFCPLLGRRAKNSRSRC